MQQRTHTQYRLRQRNLIEIYCLGILEGVFYFFKIPNGLASVNIH